MATPEQIKKALLKGCNATTAEHVYVYVEQVLTVVDLYDAEQADLFIWTVETAETSIGSRRSPRSILSSKQLIEEKGMAKVNRIKLLELLNQ